MGAKMVYLADDGSKFDTEDAAVRKNELLKAARNFAAASEELNRCLGATAMTADGKTIDSLHRGTYWYIANRHDGGLPHLMEISPWPRQQEFDNDGASPRVKIRFNRADFARRDEWQEMRLNVNDLYAGKDTAIAAHLAACEARLQEITEQLANIKKEPQIHRIW